MSRNLHQHPHHQIRRADRAVDDENWIREFIQAAPFGVLATQWEGQPFINSNIYVYDEARHAIYLHTARSGRTRANVDAHSPVCFSVSAMGRLLPAAEALKFSVEYSGVTVFGAAAVVTDEAEAVAALRQLLEKYFPHLRYGRDYRRVTPEELRRTTVYRIDISAWSGKRKQVDADFPGAFHFPERSV